jgi:hypothetical protein
MLPGKFIINLITILVIDHVRSTIVFVIALISNMARGDDEELATLGVGILAGVEKKEPSLGLLGEDGGCDEGDDDGGGDEGVDMKTLCSYGLLLCRCCNCSLCRSFFCSLLKSGPSSNDEMHRADESTPPAVAETNG